VAKEYPVGMFIIKLHSSGTVRELHPIPF